MKQITEFVFPNGSAIINKSEGFPSLFFLRNKGVFQARTAHIPATDKAREIKKNVRDEDYEKYSKIFKTYNDSCIKQTEVYSIETKTDEEALRKFEKTKEVNLYHKEAVKQLSEFIEYLETYY
jgi:hypothetical protein